MFQGRGRGRDLSLKPMNCPESTVRLSSRAPLLPWTCRCGSVRWGAVTATSARDADRSRPRPPVHPGRRAHLLPADQLQDEITALLGLVRDGTSVSRWSRRSTCSTRPEKYLGTRSSGMPAGCAPWPRRCAPRPRLRRQRGRRRVLRPQDRRGRPRRARPGSGRSRDPGRPHDAARGFQLEYIDADRPAQAPGGHPPRIFGSYERFIGISPSITPARSPTWLAPGQARVLRS